jgi:hypothetical protein
MRQQAQTKCDMKSVRKWYGAMILTGAILWVVVGIIFSLREPGNGNGVYRKTHDLIFLLGIGITLILTSLAHLLWLHRHSSKKLAVTAVINVLGGLTFLGGGILVAINPGPFPLFFLLVIRFLLPASYLPVYLAVSSSCFLPACLLPSWLWELPYCSLTISICRGWHRYWEGLPFG